MIWNPKRNRQTARGTGDCHAPSGPRRRRHRHETLEPRRLLAADPIHLGLVYLETDYLETDQDVGGDSRGDRFLLSFTGGAPETELREVRIRTDKDGDGITIGDSIYDTAEGGLGKNGSHSFQVLRSNSVRGETIEAIAEVEDGGQELILRLRNFHAGDRLEFTIDVDEVLRIAADPAVFNDRLDVITSGQEFQDSVLQAVFDAPHFETSSADAVFVNEYGDPWTSVGIPLPPDQGDDVDSRPNRSAAASATVSQTPKPIELSGHVWVDNNLDAVRQDDESALQGIEIALWKQNASGDYVDTGMRATTDIHGHYAFPSSLGLSPGRYQIVQDQPSALMSVAAVPGQIISPWTQSQPIGIASSINTLTDIELPLGEMSAVNLDFAEAMPAALSGFVYADRNENGQRDAGEQPIAGVAIAMVPVTTLAPQERLVAHTDAQGFYSFENLSPGTYEVVQLEQPQAYLDGHESLGTLHGESLGVIGPDGDRFVDIVLQGDDAAAEFNFGEIPLSSLRGAVFVSAGSEDCNSGHPTSQTQPLSDVRIELQTEDGVLVAHTITDADGNFAFDQIPSGQYQLVQHTPQGLIDGSAHAGRIDQQQIGVPTGGSTIDQIVLPAGVDASEFYFCEIEPSSIRGRVWQEDGSHDDFDPDDEALSDVEIELTNDRDEVIARTVTDGDGNYVFDGLPPGNYGIRQRQPTDNFHGSQRPGDSGGRVVADDHLVDIELTGGTDASGYDFWELPPATLSGFVFQDGQPLPMSSPPGLAQLRQLRDGQHTSDDTPIAGVVIELLDASGKPVDASAVLPGMYEQGVVHAITDADGYYSFGGLRPGEYHIIQRQPAGFLDGFDTAGTSGGVAAGSASLPTLQAWQQIQEKLLQLGFDSHHDAILNVPLGGDEHSQHNNFSEIVLTDPPVTQPPDGPEPVEPPLEPPLNPQPEPEPEPSTPDPVTETPGENPQPPQQPEAPQQPEPSRPPEPPRQPADPILPQPPLVVASFEAELPRAPRIETFDPALRVASFSYSEGPESAPQYGNDWAVSWHLSVINAGYPRGVVSEDGMIRAVNFRHTTQQWHEGQHSEGRWTIGSLDGTLSQNVAMQLGAEAAIALAGDFDGDGSDEAVIYVRGQWFVDLNGNGRWDQGDLWIQLGTEMDRPVVGDWDGDGKDDVGIFGRQWQRDADRISREPGLPDPANTRRRAMRVIAASTRLTGEGDLAPGDHPRLLRRGSDGPLRADAVDHVFQYGNHFDTPVTGDWNGDGIDQIAAYRNGHWLLDVDGDGRWTDADQRVQFGRPEDQPIVGDFNGDQIDEIGVVRGDLWIIDTDGDRRLTGNDLQIHVPRDSADSQPVVGDWDGDGKDEPGYYDAA